MSREDCEGFGIASDVGDGRVLGCPSLSESMMMTALIPFNSSLVPLIEGLWSSNP